MRISRARCPEPNQEELGLELVVEHVVDYSIEHNMCLVTSVGYYTTSTNNLESENLIS